jgi:5-methylcytosine-specific restriction endonuclease McrA
VSPYISEELRRHVRDEAENRCGYCLSPQHLVFGTLEIEHLLPRSQGGTSDEVNLWIACRLCNNFKSDQTHAVDHESGGRELLFNPRHQDWNEHFSWSEDGTRILGKTPCGRATVLALQLNNIIAVTVRRYWAQAG